MKILPLRDYIQIRTDEVKAGMLNTSSKASAVEYGEVIAVGPEQDKIKVGDKLMFKSWGVDSIYHEDKWYRFINPETGCIMAVCK